VSDNRGTNLADIIGRTDQSASERHWDERVVTFFLGTDGLTLVEACDDYFSVTLNAAEVDRLINWLTDVRETLKEPS
jgi:predicted NAD-dependent protein-ADP-ribosyltransferase YbiA (DUF1768 family)